MLPHLAIPACLWVSKDPVDKAIEMLQAIEKTGEQEFTTGFITPFGCNRLPWICVLGKKASRSISP